MFQLFYHFLTSEFQGKISVHEKRKTLKKFGKPKYHENPKKHQKHHKNLSKKHLQMWMTTTDNLHEELYSMMEDSEVSLYDVFMTKYARPIIK